jgi:hypothetical protein
VTDKRLYTENASGTVVELGTNPGSAVTHTAGTAGAPAITTTGDTNTGIFFPAADTVAASVGGTEGLRLTSTGLGVGTSSPADKLQVLGTIRFGANATYYGTITHDASSTGANIYNHVDSGGHLFQVGGTTLMNLTASGNLGLGATPSAWSSSVATQVGYGAALSSRAAGNTASDVTHGAYWNGTNWLYQYSSVGASRYQMTGANAGSTHAWFVSAGGTAGNAISFTQAMTLDASGRLGIGTTSPASVYRMSLTGDGSSIVGGLALTSSGNTAYIGQVGGTSADCEYWNAANGYMRFATNNTERARITSGGDLLVGTTSTLNNSRFYSVTTGNAISGGFKNDTAGYQTIQVWNAATSGTRYLIQFSADTGGTGVGLVTTDGSNTTYGTSSDYRLKENIAPMTGALAKVAALKPCTYTWKATGAAGQGFIAHELQDVVPDAVVGEKDAVNEDGSIRPQNIDTSFLVATLAAAIQEQQAMIQQLQAEVAALKGT